MRFRTAAPSHAFLLDTHAVANVWRVSFLLRTDRWSLTCNGLRSLPLPRFHAIPASMPFSLQEDDTQEGYRALVTVKDGAKGKVMQVRWSCQQVAVFRVAHQRLCLTSFGASVHIYGCIRPSTHIACL